MRSGMADIIYQKNVNKNCIYKSFSLPVFFQQENIKLILLKQQPNPYNRQFHLIEFLTPETMKGLQT